MQVVLFKNVYYCCYGNWSINRVTGVRGLCPDRNVKTVTSRKSLLYGIFGP